MKIIADDKIPFLRGVLEPYAEVVYLPGKAISHNVLKDADAMLIRTRTKCDARLLHNTNVRFIATATIGYDHIDTRYCEQNGVIWTNAPGCNSASVQQYVAAALLTVAAGFRFDISRKTIGIIGVGNVGSKIAKLAKVLGMKVLLNDPPRARMEGGREFTDLENLLNESDIVTVHVPLTMKGEDKTYHLFDHFSFNKMKKGSFFLNTSRGEVTDSNSLKKMLRESKIAAAVIDVWENEPDVDQELISMVEVATPHIAGYSADGKANGTAMAVNSLGRFYNLPLDMWYPANVPGPASSEILIDGTGRTDQDILREAVLHTYDIKADDEKFRKTPSDFEKQRGNYSLRREFPSYSVKLTNSSENVRSVIEKMEFKLVGHT